MTERALQDAIIELAEWLGFLIHHDRPAKYRDGGWATHIQGHIGFPDLVLVHPVSGAVVVYECKSAKGRVSDQQQQWLDAFNASGSDRVRSAVVRPHDWTSGAIEDELQAYAAGWVSDG